MKILCSIGIHKPVAQEASEDLIKGFCSSCGKSGKLYNDGKFVVPHWNFHCWMGAHKAIEKGVVGGFNDRWGICDRCGKTGAMDSKGNLY